MTTIPTANPTANRAIQAEVTKLSPAAREHFEERAGILEYDGKMSRDDAEKLALLQTQQVFPQ